MSGFISTEKMPVKLILIGVATGFTIMLLSTCAICGVMLFMSSVPYQLLPYLMLIADAFGVFVGGYIAAAMHKSRGLILGLIVGVLMFVVIFAVGLSSGEPVGMITLLRLAVLIVFGMLGGIKGVNKREKIRIK